MIEQPLCSPSHQAFFSSLPLSLLIMNSIPYSLPGQEVEIHDELCCQNKKTQHHLHIEPNLHFLAWMTFLRPIAKTGLLF